MSYDIIILSETWLNCSFLNSELFQSNYSVIRDDRNASLTGRSRGGGVLIALKESLNYSIVDTSNIKKLTPLIDIIACKCYFPNSNFILCALYIPPDVNANEVEIFTDALELFFLNDNIILVGDFNLPNFCNNAVNCVKSSPFRNLCDVLHLTQYNTVDNIYNKKLDLAFSNFTNLKTLKADFPLVPEDVYHPAILMDFEILSTVKPINFPSANNFRYNFRKANFSQLYEYICDIDWSCLNLFKNVDDALTKFYAILYDAFDRFVPKYKCNSSKFPPWFTADIKFNIKTKELYRNKWRKTKQSTYLDEFIRLRSIIKEQINNAYNDYIRNVQINIKSNPSELRKFAQLKQGCSRIPGKVTDNNVTFEKLTHPH